jgi:hypothetical protein
MSWSASLGATPASEIDEKIATCATAPPEENMDEHVKEAVDLARDTAKAIIASGVVGDAEKSFTVSMSGHSNEGHEPADGWANDCMTVNVVQV